MEKIRVMFVCLGNICRSPMAESLFTHKIKRLGIEDKFIVNSSATSNYEIGKPVHSGTVKKLKEMNIDIINHKSIQLKKEDYDNYDFIIGMDESNIKNIIEIFNGKSDKVSIILSYDNDNSSVKDPWYTGNFDETFEDLDRGLDGLINYLKEKKYI